MKKIKQKIRNALVKRLAIEQPRTFTKSRYAHLLDLFVQNNPSSMVEIGVWRGDRTVQFLKRGEALRKYVGFDLFEDMSVEKYHQESMGSCTPQPQRDVLHLIEPIAIEKGCQVELVAGLTEETLPKFAKDNRAAFDFIYIDGGHSIETIQNDWKCAQELISPNGLVIFDDYYLNDDNRGAKRLIDELIKDSDYRVRFFPMIEDIIEDIQITMVAVWRLTK